MFFECHKIVEGLFSFVRCIQHCTNLSAMFLAFGMFVKMHHAQDHIRPIITTFSIMMLMTTSLWKQHSHAHTHITHSQLPSHRQLTNVHTYTRVCVSLPHLKQVGICK